MQLLDLLPTQLSGIPESLQISLKDIVYKVEIQSHCCIKHPDYNLLELPETVVSSFEKLSVDFQNKFLSEQLRNFLYGTYYNGSLKRTLALDAEVTNLALNENLENNTFFGVDVAFYDRLHESNRGVGYWNHNWLLVKKETDGMLAVNKNGLTLHVEPHTLEQNANVGDSVAIKMPKNLVQKGFYMAVANTGTPSNEKNLVRVYFNLNPEGAVAVIDSLTTQLNAINISFSLKALYNPSEYGRYDSAVLYFDKNNYQVVRPILERFYTQHQSDFNQQVPLFTKMVAPGLAIAEEPNQKFGDKESFGTNRCQVVANGLFEAWHQGNNTPAGRLASIMRHFSLCEIDLQRPYLNANSDDIYTFF
ncbi:MAG: T3SS effector HopA1 family protein [Nostoc sp. S4]|nr:T3SS effector HopA1 family protein [Nostoc sp. S4]